jgi:hypothetical protein
MSVRDALVGLHALMSTIPDLQRVRIGAPESLSNQVEGWATLGDLAEPATQRTAGGPIEIPIYLLCWFGYDVEGAEEAAELELGDFVGSMTAKLAQNQRGTVAGVTVNLAGSVKRMSLPGPASTPSEYVRYAGRETRIQVFAVLVWITQPIS